MKRSSFFSMFSSVSTKKISYSFLSGFFEKNKVGFCDIGGRGGMHPYIKKIASISKITLFEPDQKECNILKKRYKNTKIDLTIIQSALGKKYGKGYFFKTSDLAASSFLRPNKKVIERYKIFKAEPKNASRIINFNSIDNLVKNKKATAQLFEILKLDVQGLELDILKGGIKTISKNCVAIFCEVNFLKIYKNQPLFSEIELYLRNNGFIFYGFNYFTFKSSRNYLNSYNSVVRERLYWADAVFFKDPFEKRRRKLRKRQAFLTMLSAWLFEYFDFALEISYLALKKKMISKQQQNEFFNLCKQSDLHNRQCVFKTNQKISGQNIQIANKLRFYSDNKNSL